MSDTQLIAIAAISLYFLVMIFIGLLAAKDKTKQAFEIANRNVGYIPTIGSLSTSMRDGIGLVFWFGLGATAGYAGLWFMVGALCGMGIYFIIGPRVRAIAKEKEYITINQMLAAKFGPITEKLTGAISIFFGFAVIAIQLAVSGTIISTLLTTSPWVGILSVASIVGFYLYLGGYNTVVKTDTIQFLFILAFLSFPLFFPAPKEAVLAFDTFISLGLWPSVGLGLMGLLYVLSSGDIWQRIFSARDDKVIKTSFPISVIFLTLMTTSIIFLGMACAPFMRKSIEASDAFYQIFSSNFITPPLLTFIAVVSMAVCMSTLDTMCYLLTSTVAKNFMPTQVAGNHKKYIKFSQGTIIFVLAIGSVVAMTIEDIIVFILEAGSLLLTLVPIYLYAAFGYPRYKNQKTDAYISAGLGVSICFYLYLFAQGAFANFLMVSAPALCSAIITTAAIALGQKHSLMKRLKKQ